MNGRVVMAYIVDGNNVMGQTPGWHRDKSRAKRLLLEKLAAFARLKKVRVTVVFDGGPDSTFPDGSAFHGVKILYAERGSDADTRIKGLVEASTDPRGLTVVTSDRHLGFLVRSRGALVIRSGEFRTQVERLLESTPNPEDGEQFEVGDINSWLRYFGSLPHDDDLSEG
jgi:predicted RNA-binding protein with PIN domain